LLQDLGSKRRLIEPPNVPNRAVSRVHQFPAFVVETGDGRYRARKINLTVTTTGAMGVKVFARTLAMSGVAMPKHSAQKVFANIMG
jgi:hypothetical protein